jgi:ribonuclease G
MSKEIYISSTPHETRLAIVENDALTEIYYERENEYTLAGSIYNGRVTRVLPGMQSSFVDIGLERDAFLYITDFLEEAPDSAEFDTTSHADHAPRAPRTIEGEAAVRTDGGQRPERSDRGERNDRGGRGRRGGRDRDRGERPVDRSVEPARSDVPRPYTEAAEFTPAPMDGTSETAEIGEGAPGADGSRRWRGRRGRRRGRGNTGLPGEPSAGAVAPATFSSDAQPELESHFEGDSTFEIDGAEEAPVSAAPPAERGFERGGFAPRGRDRGRGDRGRREGRRDGQRGGTPRQDSASDIRQPRVPRGFAPTTSLYGVEMGETASATGPIANAYPDADAPTGAEPLILPGESLGKYRKGDDPAPSTKAAEATPVTLAPPANLYTLAEGWDGGAVLPGETIRPRSVASQPMQSEVRGGFDRGGRRDGRGDGRRDDRRDGRQREVRGGERFEARHAPAVPVARFAAPVVEALDGPSVVETPETQPEVARAGHPEAYAPAEILHEAVPVATETAAVPMAAVEPVVVAEPVEYEPAEAAVSYRVDPLPRTEYRQSGTTLEPELETAEAVHEGSLAHTVTPAPQEPVVRLHSEAEPAVDLASPSEAAVELHEVTSISATGEMHSGLPVEAPAVQHSGALAAPEFQIPAELPVEAPVGFVPGPGDLAEEVLEDEEFDGALHASSIEEIDYEEETLEGAADLGTMLREMSIDQITRTSPEQDEEDDLEEDLIEEDELPEEEDDAEFEEGGADPDPEMEAGFEDTESAAEGFSEEAARTGTAADAAYFAGQFGQAEGERNGHAEGRNQGQPGPRDAERRGGRREGGRRDGRRRREGRSGEGDRARSAGGSGDRERSGGGRSRSMQSTNLPAISDLLKPGQEILVQIAKEPIAKKGARITSHIALPGRFLVFMPTVSHTGVSRKIESDAERRRLKEILLSEKGDAAGGFIVRTAAEGASEEELRSDLRFLLNLWSDIKARSESSKSPALIYHDLNLIERILRDQVTDNFSAIWVDTESEYERVLRFLQRFQPSLIRRVKLYTKETPLFEQFGITEEINKALRSKVWLKSGGSIVINQTEALVAIDINTGKFVGKTARLEDTIVKTNLDAIPEIVRQIRLRDLGGIIIIDFIDMDERKNRNRVMAALEEELKADRAPSKILQFNDFGLVAITRKRVKQSLERTLSTTCNVCVGTGMVKSPITVCNDIYVEMRKMHKHLDRGDVMLRVHPDVVKQLKTSGSKWLQEMEEMCGKTILVKSDPSLHPEQFDIH